ncbi:MAG: hypothetical protein K1Y36_13360 [Blastocatellia bacterium]|nr:hypothetical protein [Blastocatellia bacterium]
MPTGSLAKRLWFEEDTGTQPDVYGCSLIRRVVWNGVLIGRVRQSTETGTWGNDEELGTYPWQTPEEAAFHLVGRYEVTHQIYEDSIEWNVYLADSGVFWMGPFPSREEAERAVHTTAGFDLPFESDVRQDKAGTAKFLLQQR